MTTTPHTAAASGTKKLMSLIDQLERCAYHGSDTDPVRAAIFETVAARAAQEKP